MPVARKPAERTYSLDELATLSDLSRRTVRYYIQLGLVDRPLGETRAAHYAAKHLEQLLQIRKWTQAGVSLERIRELLSGESPPVPARARGSGTVEVWSHLVIGDGIELAVDPAGANLSPEQLRAFFRGAMALYGNVKKKE